LALPQEVIDSMPRDTFLDGELWYGLISCSHLVMSLVNFMFMGLGLGWANLMMRDESQTDSMRRDSIGRISNMWYSMFPTITQPMNSVMQNLVILSLSHTHKHTHTHFTVEELFGNGKCKYVTVAKKELCKDIQHLESFFQDVLDNGGEGVILRDPKSPWETGRCKGYLKHKVPRPTPTFSLHLY